MSLEKKVFDADVLPLLTTTYELRNGHTNRIMLEKIVCNSTKYGKKHFEYKPAV